MPDPALAPVILHAMRVCRGDFGRMMADTDYCMDCPLLIKCNADKRSEERENTHA